MVISSTTTEGASAARGVSNAVDVLTSVESAALADHEEVIGRGLRTFVDVGTRLAVIRDRRLYRGSHGTFEQYCCERWGFADRRARQLIDAAAVSGALPTRTIVPESEAQARALIGLTPTQAAIVMRVAHERTGGKVTAAAISEAKSRPWTEADMAVEIGGYRILPALSVWPEFGADLWKSFVDSISKLGLIAPISVSYDGRIVDGRHRMAALRWLGVDPATATAHNGKPAIHRLGPHYTETGLIDHVVSCNARRAHYTKDQLSMIAASW